MNDLFMALLLHLQEQGNITEANLYSSGKYSSICIEAPNGVSYQFSITRKEEEKENA